MPGTMRKFTRRPNRASKKRRTTKMARNSRVPTTAVVHRFVRGCAMQTITGNVAFAPYQSVLGATLDNVLNHTEFTNLYDQFRIDWVKAQFYLRIDPGAQVAAGASYPRLYWVRDKDDQALASLNDIRENSLGKRAILHPNRAVTIWFKPNVLSEIYRTAVSTGYSPKFSQWIDCTTPNLVHYGIKYCIDDLTNTNYKVDLEIQYGVSMRQSR